MYSFVLDWIYTVYCCEIRSNLSYAETARLRTAVPGLPPSPRQTKRCCNAFRAVILREGVHAGHLAGDDP